MAAFTPDFSGPETDIYPDINPISGFPKKAGFPFPTPFFFAFILFLKTRGNAIGMRTKQREARIA